MPIAQTPEQITGLHLIGPFVESDQGNKYAFAAVDHFSGYQNT